MGRFIKAKRGKLTAQSTEVVDPRVNIQDRGQYSQLNCPTLLGEELTNQTCT
jgi:hypothetical protein